MGLLDTILARDNGPDDLVTLQRRYDAIRVAEDDRILRMKMYRDENNDPRRLPTNEITPDHLDYGRRRDLVGPQRHRLPLPFGKALTVKHAYRISGKLPDVIVDQRDESAEERFRSDSMEKIAWSVMRASKAETNLSAGGWHASELGSACFDLYWDFTEQIPKFRAIDPLSICVVPGMDDPHDFQEVYRHWNAPVVTIQAEYEGKSFRGEPIDVSLLQSSVKDEKTGLPMLNIVQNVTKQKMTRFVKCGDKVVGLWEREHNYGFVPYIVIPNVGPYDEIWGWADYEFVRSLAHYIPAMFARQADVLRSVGNGAYQENGTGVASATITRIIREGGVVSTRRDSKVEPITPPQMPAFASEHSDMALEFLKMLGFAPDSAWGTQHYRSSGSADKGQLQPLVEYTAMKQLNWQAGLTKLFGQAYRMIERELKEGSVTYHGTQPGKAGARHQFAFTFGPGAEAVQGQNEQDDGFGNTEIDVFDIPTDPTSLFKGDYSIRFTWRNEADPADPSYILAELNKFQNGVQSLETTLENLGFQAPEDEMRRIEKESERFPWINDGRVALLVAQLGKGGQGQGGGNPADPSGATADAMSTLGGSAAGGDSGALDSDVLARSGGKGSAGGQLYGGA